MYCPQCGSPNDDSARFCMACGVDIEPYRQRAQQAQPVRGPQQQPENLPLDQRLMTQQPHPEPYQNAAYAPPKARQAPWPQMPPPSGAMPIGTPAPAQVKSYLGWAIATLILCFWPTGIVAVVHATRVGNRLAAGDYNGAQESSRKAKWWTQLSFNIAVAFVVIAVVTAILVTIVARY